MDCFTLLLRLLPRIIALPMSRLSEERGYFLEIARAALQVSHLDLQFDQGLTTKCFRKIFRISCEFH
jgi:hypothetical protein